jgi:SAM-dependent methyltransferase
MRETGDNQPGPPGPDPGPSDQSKLWNYYQNKRPESFSGAESRLKTILTYISRGESALNIGIGSGRFEEIAVAKGINIHSVDPDAEAIANLRQRLSMGEKARVGRIQCLPFAPLTFEKVVASEVIEHLSSDEAALGLSEIHRVLRPNGLLIGTVPAREQLDQQICVCPKCETVFHRWGHQQSFTRDSLSALLGTAFPTVTIKEKSLVDWSRLNWKGRIASVLRLFQVTIGIQGSNNNFLFLARKP